LYRYTKAADATAAFDGLILAGLPPVPSSSRPPIDTVPTAAALPFDGDACDSPSSRGKWGEVATEEADAPHDADMVSDDGDAETVIDDDDPPTVETVSALLPAYSMRYAVEAVAVAVGGDAGGVGTEETPLRLNEVSKDKGMRKRGKHMRDLGEAVAVGAWTRVTPAALNRAMHRHPAAGPAQAARLHSAGTYAAGAYDRPLYNP
jgi:hypothetical protein